MLLIGLQPHAEQTELTLLAILSSARKSIDDVMWKFTTDDVKHAIQIDRHVTTL